MKVGTPKYGGGKKVFKMKDGDNVYRILPPLGKLADKGRWSAYYRVEWGYKDLNDHNCPFQDCRVVNRKTQMVEVESAAHLRRENLVVQKNQLVDLFKQGKATKEQVAQVVELIKQYNLDSKHYLNVVNLQNEIGLLKIGHKAKLALDGAIKSFREQGVDPLGVTGGIYFNFNRSCATGNFRDTIVQVSPYRENIQAQINGVNQIVQQIKSHSMDEAFISRLANEAYELGEMYPTPTAAQVARMVTEGSTAVDEILGKTSKNQGTEEYNEEHIEEEYTAPATAPSALGGVFNKPTTQPTTPATAPVTAPIAPPVQTTAPIKPAVTTPPVASTQAAPTTAPKTTNAAMSDEDFLKSIGIG